MLLLNMGQQYSGSFTVFIIRETQQASTLQAKLGKSSRFNRQAFVMISSSTFNALPFHLPSLCQQLWPISGFASVKEWGLQRCSLYMTEGYCAEQLRLIPRWSSPSTGWTVKLYRRCTVGTNISPTEYESALPREVTFIRRKKSVITNTYFHTPKLIIMTWMSALAP